MRRLLPGSVAAVSVAFAIPLAAQPAATADGVAELTRLDLAQKKMVADGDEAGLAALAAPELTINAPTNRVLSHDQFFAMMRDGRIGAEQFERTVESVQIGEGVGIVMGSEVFTPTVQSELGRKYGAVPLKRRYTNVYVRERGKWRWFARHANVVPTK